MLTIAFFVSDHGFGHAARISALTEYLSSNGDFSFNPVIVSAVPEHFFKQSLPEIPFTYIHYKTDIGLVQKDPIHEDIEATLNLLSSFFPTYPSEHRELIDELKILNTSIIVSDISPLGLVLANHLAIPSVVFENFLWPWIYDGYPDYKDDFEEVSTWMNSLYESADLHIISKPYCHPFEGAITVGPVARKSRISPEVTRKQLKIPEHDTIVLLTMGGIPTSYSFLDDLYSIANTTFILPGSYPEISFKNNIRILPHQSEFYHPDLMRVSDFVIGKLGYSTIAEVMAYQPVFGWIGRPNFRESPVLADYVRKNTSGMEISYQDFEDGNMADIIKKVMSISPGSEKDRSGLTDTTKVFNEFMSSIR